MAEKTVYRVDGLSCTNCAAKFERNVKEIEGVTEAIVNFGASKITVTGEASIQQIEQAGAFEHLKIIPEKESFTDPEHFTDHQSFIRKNWRLLLSGLFIAVGYASQIMNGEDFYLTNALFIFAIFIGGYSLFKEGFKNLLKFEFTMETLMTIAIIGAAFIGEWAEGSIVVILFAVSEALERYSMDKARQSIRSLMDIAPKEALVRRSGTDRMVHVDDIQIGDIMIIKPGQKIAMDGHVVKGYSAVNQAAITGESIPVEKNIDDSVFAGTLNEEGLLEVAVTKRVEDTTISKIIHLVEEAQGERAPAQAFVDTFAKYYTPAIIVIAALIATVPPLLFGGNWETWVYQGLSVLVVGCPCALVVSTPVAIVTAIGNAAKNGVLVKGGVYLEEIGGLKAIAFDKTGTLTKGVPVVTDYIELTEATNIQHNKNYIIMAALEQLSQHPLASAIIKYGETREMDLTSINVNDFTSITGKGIRGTVDGNTYYVGSPVLFKELLASQFTDSIHRQVSDLQLKGKTAMLFGTNQKLISIVAVADEVRSSSQHVIKRLHELGIEKTIMLTGDNQATAQAIGQQVGVSEIEGELMPQDKLDYIKQLKINFGKVAMVGDGINDAPALAAATVGIAMGGAGTDTAIETADVALMGDDLQKLPFTVKLSRKTLQIIKQNITFSLVIKLIALLLVIPGWLTLWIAIMADMGATLLVTLNGLRLMKVKD
ncbi:TPA_asm: cation-transporting P-type ATPase [Listeria monocytogenes]|nr:cadmium-translocating P-type ATPase [Listeria monocytogenes]EAE3984654.1 cadmium-translocating P-type ATPase [Listeria monocytogenes]EJD7562341.1 cadmium-translocating P-type ATPase [Listeria monocytogenes]HAA5090683.1 cation-transporting P-type ATPase [Listeria monocytogenes]HAB0262512.1 cation-transporting P-type ATPase [Listeria monocytogenes]